MVRCRASWSFPFPCTLCAARASQSRFAVGKVWSRAVPVKLVSGSSSDRMPRGFEFDEVADLVDTLRLLAVPVEFVVPFARANTLDAFRGAKLKLLLLFRAHYRAQSAYVGVS